MWMSLAALQSRHAAMAKSPAPLPFPTRLPNANISCPAMRKGRTLFARQKCQPLPHGAGRARAKP